MNDALHARPNVRCRTRRRGSVYALVLGVAMLITVIGMGALATARVTSRAASTSNDWAEAGTIAFSAAEHAVAKLNADAAAAPDTWRNAYTDGAVAFSASFGRGTLKWMLVDGAGFLADGTRSPTDDRVINDDYGDDLTVYGIGQVGTTTRVYSVRLNAGGAALDVLRCPVHTTAGVTLNAPAYLTGGPLSTAGALTTSAASNLRGRGGAAETGSAKRMPSAGVFDMYKSMATAIPSSVASGGTFSPGTLSAADNPYGEENPNGIYHLRLPSTLSTLTILPSRIKATLLIEAADGVNQKVDITGDIFWDAHSDRFPILITRGIKKIKLEGDIDPFSYNGESLPSELRGLIHMIQAEDLQLQDAAFIRGCVIVDGGILTVPSTATAVGMQLDPNLRVKPPYGYARGDKLVPVPGSWRWAAPPPGVN